MGFPLTEACSKLAVSGLLAYMLYSSGHYPQNTSYIRDMAKELKKMSLNVTQQEFNALEEFAGRDGRTKTEVLREFIRTLPTYRSDSQATS